jgi:V/A-type H+-transporting ATPase subunit I
VLVPMTKVRILGRRRDAARVLGELHRLGLVEIAEAPAQVGQVSAEASSGCDIATSVRTEELLELREGVEAVITRMPTEGSDTEMPIPPPGRSLPQDIDRLRADLDHLTGALNTLDRRLSELREERVVLTHHVGALRQLMPLVPVLAGLGTDRLRRLGIATMALVLDTDEKELVDALRSELASTLGDNFELVSTSVPPGPTGCLVIVPSDRHDAVQAVLGSAAVRPVALPDGFSGLSLHAAVEAMTVRLEEISAQVDAAAEERLLWLAQHRQRLSSIRAALDDWMELARAAASIGATERAFLLECWVARPALPELRRELRSRLGPPIVVEDMAPSPYDPMAPVLIRNARLPRPFESLVGFLGLPRPGSVDPTTLMSLFLPLMFGAMVGDVGYGLLLLVVALVTRRRLAARAVVTPELRGLLGVLLWGSAWSIVFGGVYGEAFGDLGARIFGDWAIWQYRGSPHALTALLTFAVVLGAVHVGLGLALGAWQAIQFKEPRDLLDKLGTMVALTGLFGLGGFAVDRLPGGALTPSAGAVAVGLVLVLSVHGWLGVVTGALDLVGRIGNILSYLRVAAVGLASAHLAGVANELGSVGPIWVGVLVAAFLHALNLALAAFSPTIQALRLNYVEFFGTFFVTGGHAFTPFGHPRRRQAPSTT